MKDNNDTSTGRSILIEKPKKIRPCDCPDMYTAMKMEDQGIAFNDDSIHLEPNSVILTRGHTTIRIPMSLFKKFAEWYLTEQDIKE